jgi:hypothetical protein
LFLYIIATIVLLWFAPVAMAADSSDSAYLTELVRHATEVGLAEERTWHMLLHYRRNIFGGYTSEADDPGFFLSPDGKTDPQAELNATLAHLFSPELVGRSRQPAQCAFIARYTWLKDRLSIDDGRLSPLPCERFHNWYHELNPQSLTLVFPSAYMNNPSSMFGHTLLRIDQKGQTEQTRILAYTINYAADVPRDEGVSFAVKGIFGGYKGYFSTVPYYLKVREYRDIENRDIWEYRLNLTDDQLRRMLMHAWELGNAYFDYFFFKENCSYHLLSLLEVANPDWHLTDEFIFWTVPVDTIRSLTRQPGLVGDIVYRPARSTQIKQKREHLSEEEQSRMQLITKDARAIKSDAFRQLAPPRQAFVLDLASDYLRYRSVRDEERAPEYKERNRAVLNARSGLREKPDDLKVVPLTSPPDQGHKTSRSGVGLGWRNNELFEEINVRAGYHDLLDPGKGYQPDAQIELLSAALRHYEGSDQVRLERLTLANIISLSPMDALFKAPSWKVNIGMDSVRHNSCAYCSTGLFNAGIGAAVESHVVGREVFFAFAEIESAYGHAYEEHHRIGAGGTVGLTATVTERWKMLLSTTYLKFPFGEKSDDWRLSFGQRYTLTQNLALRVEFHHRDHRDNEAVFFLHTYF